jgi:hypothetical protein
MCTSPLEASECTHFCAEREEVSTATAACAAEPVTRLELFALLFDARLAAADDAHLHGVDAGQRVGHERSYLRA